MKTKRQEITYTLVNELYATSQREMGKWMWENHVQWVSNKAVELAKKYNADQDKVYAGALLHDIGDIWLERDSDEFEKKSSEASVEILTDAGFSKEEIDEVMINIIAPHSCYPDNLPKTIESKCLATADAMFHLVTDFFPQFSWKHLPNSMNYIEWIEWITEKIERDFNNKIFFESEKKEVEPHYQALKKVYVSSEKVGNKN